MQYLYDYIGGNISIPCLGWRSEIEYPEYQISPPWIVQNKSPVSIRKNKQVTGNE